MMDTVARLKHAARDPIGQALPRCADAAPIADEFGVVNGAPVAKFRAPQERINAAQIEADEYAECWMMRHGLFIFSAAMVATFCVVVGLRFVDYVHDKTQADLRLYEKFQEGK